MIQKGAALLAVLALVSLAMASAGQANQPTQARPPGSSTVPTPRLTAAPQVLPPAPAAGRQSLPNGSGAPSGCVGGDCDVATPRITIATPAPAPAPWPWQQRVSWGADLLLVVMGYVAILMALALLRKIEKQGRFTEEAAQAATESARAALKVSEALERAERPWLLISVRAAQDVENGFTVIAINRGRTPARIISSIDQTVCAVDETHLDATPTYKGEPVTPTESIILLPDETTELVSFNRADVKQVCETEVRMKRVEDWDEKIYLYGKVTYRSLTASEDTPPLESSWFCWYIHGRQKSGMVIAGPPAYNRHT